MRILHLGKYYPPESGGIESVTEVLSNGFSKNGDEVEVICMTRHHTILKEVVNPHLTIWRYKTVLEFMSQPVSLYYCYRAILRSQYADIVHIHLPNYLVLFILPLLPKSRKILVHWHSDVLHKGLLAKVLEEMLLVLLRRVDLVIATSENYAKASPTLSRMQEKVRIITLGIPNNLNESERVTTTSCNKTVSILSVGRLVEYKGFKYLIEALSKTPSNINLTIIGSGHLKEDLIKLTTTLNLENRVQFKGRVNNQVLLDCFNQCDIFCLPSISRAEAFGVVLLEAMRHSKPIITCSISGSGVPWVNENRVTGINVSPKNSEQLSEAIIMLSESKELRDQLGRNGKVRFKTMFTDEIMISSFDKLYRTLINT